jgi:transcription elongation factor Elf1
MKEYGLNGRHRLQSKHQPKHKPKLLHKLSNPFTNCSFCQSNSFFEGPEINMEMVVKCADCGARFNIAALPSGTFLLETLSGPVEGYSG